mmetsp:Transcript_97475/g.170071  ORF Transcript_97475/g.170071 Transcript_97475/m.170071 type:complete len:611 (-) Transcript_97475:48-1880(-)
MMSVAAVVWLRRQMSSQPRGLVFVSTVYSLAFAVAASVCRWLGSQHAYGAHTQSQVALAIALCTAFAGWVIAELAALYDPKDTSSTGHKVFELVPTREPLPETVGVAEPKEEAAAEHNKVSKDEDNKESTATCEKSEKFADQDGDPEHGVLEASDNGKPALHPVLKPLAGAVEPLRAAAELAAILAFLYLCDRTDFFEKSKKLQDPNLFWGLWVLITVVALCTVRTLESSKPLQREQTDEWKGWMQIMFIMYHYFNQKSVYNAIRVYIAAYVFMTGYGNWSLYIRGKSFTIRRSMQMLFRLNFLGFFVCVALTNEYMLYYICAMHTLFTIFVIIALYIKQELNKSSVALHVKVFLTLAFTVLIYDGPPVIFRAVFGTLPVVRPLFAFHDPLHPEFTDEMHEWHFRSGLDRFIWIVGMAFALHYQKFEALFDRLQALTPLENVLWSCLVVSPVLLVAVIWIEYCFKLDKFAYNKVHAYTSAIPILAYLFLRNISRFFRQRYLFLFAYVGRITLETYILQFHVWMRTTGLNGSPKKLLVWIPQTYLPPKTAFLANLGLTTLVYFFVSVRLSKLTVVLRDALIPEDKRTMAVIWACVAAASAFFFAASYAIRP